MEVLLLIQWLLICCQYALFLEGDGMVFSKEPGCSFLKMFLGTRRACQAWCWVLRIENKTDSSLDTWKVALESHRPDSALALSLASLGPWGVDFTSLSLDFLTCEMGIILLLILQGGFVDGLRWVCPAHCLA